MEGKPFVFDVSSDEELGFTEPTVEDFDWLTKFFQVEDEGGKNDGNDDSDDVVILGEVLAKPKKARKTSNAIQKHDDDDCVVLDGDPEKAFAEDDESDSGSDDLVVVGEKGQVACRDYPHSRHQCATFPFNSTPHDKRCDLCHCYVCDSLAPCEFWGTGVSHTDHCHATDKLKFWKLERTKVREGQSTPSPVTKLSGAHSTAQPIRNQIISHPQPVHHKASVSTACTLYNQIPRAAHSNVSVSPVQTLGSKGTAPSQVSPCSASVSTVQAQRDRVMPPPQLAHNCVSQSQAPIPASPSGLHSSFDIPNIISQSRTHRRSIASSRSRLQPNMPQQLPDSCNSSLQRDRYSISGHFFCSQPAFKRPSGPRQFLGAHRTVYSSSNDFDLPYSQYLNVHLAAKPIEANPVRFPQASPLEDLESFLQHDASSTMSQSQVYTGTVPSQLLQYGPPPQPIDSSFISNQSQNVAAQGFSHSSTLLDETVQSCQQSLIENSQPGGAMAGGELLPVADQDPPPSPAVASPPVTMNFSFGNWLLENQSDDLPLFPEMNYPSSVSAPVDAGIPYFD